MIKVDVKLTGSGKKRLNPVSYNRVGETLAKGMTEEMFDYIMQGGLGSRLGREPTGGAPIWEDRPENDPDDAVKRMLIDSHSMKVENGIGTISASAYYADWVIKGERSGYWIHKYNTPMYGKPNPYNKRTVDEKLNDKNLNYHLSKGLRDNGLR